MRDGFQLQIGEESGSSSDEHRQIADRLLNELARLVGIATALEDIAKAAAAHEGH